MVALLLLALLALQPPAVQQRDTIDRLMAVVGGQTITLSDVNAALQFGLVETPANAPDRPRAALDRLIERSLILAEVERYQPPEPEPIEITIRLDQLQHRAGSKEAFDRALAVTGTTRDELRRYIRDDLRMATYLNQRFGDTAERSTAIADWMAELRRRAEVTVLYR